MNEKTKNKLDMVLIWRKIFRPSLREKHHVDFISFYH
jgi:hypothetical protein